MKYETHRIPRTTYKLPQVPSLIPVNFSLLSDKISASINLSHLSASPSVPQRITALLQNLGCSSLQLILNHRHRHFPFFAFQQTFSSLICHLPSYNTWPRGSTFHTFPSFNLPTFILQVSTVKKGLLCFSSKLRYVAGLINNFLECDSLSLLLPGTLGTPSWFPM